MGIFKDAVLGITKYCSNWKVQLGALAVDQYISWKRGFIITLKIYVKK